jgi:hypothetical protein
VAEEDCWAITQAEGRLRCGLSGYSVPEFRFPLNSLAYTYIVDHMYTRLRLAQNSTCAGPSGRQLLRKSGSRNCGIFTGNSTLTKERPIPTKN